MKNYKELISRVLKKHQKFLSLQETIFTVLILGVGVSILFQISRQQFSVYFMTIYFPIAFGALVVYLLYSKVQKFQLYLYYNVWIKHIFKILGHRGYYNSLIRDSWSKPNHTEGHGYSSWLKGKSHKNKPDFVRREHLMAKNFWPNWAFSAVVLFNKVKITCDQDKNFCLEVDLCDQSYGIYNNAGKEFLKKTFLGNEKDNLFNREDEKIEHFLNAAKPGEHYEINCQDTPLRWASGGVLPIACREGKYYYVLFFRGIQPEGWNVANGASETEDEYINLHSLMVREFSEELMLLKRKPLINESSVIDQILFKFPCPIMEELPDEVRNNIRSESFMEKHRNLREVHDKFEIKPIQGPRLGLIKTPFVINIYDRNLEKNDPQKVEDVIFSINLFEFGIESTSLYWFEMGADDYPIFGEIWEVADCLLREPVLLLSCDYIQKVFEDNGGTLGKRIKEDPYSDCKCLERIPSNEYQIFDIDIEFRKRRKDLITKDEVDLLFSIDLSFQSELDSNSISEDLRRAFEDNGISLFQNLFSWDNVPGKDSKKLRDNLREYLDIDWTQKAEIRKFNDEKTIRIFKDENSAEILIDREKERATLKISDGRIYNLKVKKKNGKLNISLQKASISIEEKGSIWMITNKDEKNKKDKKKDKHLFLIKKEEDKLNIYEFSTTKIEDEFDLHRRWLEKFENLFKELQKEGCDIEKNKHRPACMLCPVTWKTIETVCKYDILKDLPECKAKQKSHYSHKLSPFNLS